MSEEKRTATCKAWGDVEVLAGPVFVEVYDYNVYWCKTKGGSLVNVAEDDLTFPPKAESFSNIGPFGVAFGYVTREAANQEKCKDRLAVLHRWEDQSGQWFAELLNDE